MKAQFTALELVLALIVLVIVAYILLQFFQTNFSGKTEEFFKIETKEKASLTAEKALSVCKQLCKELNSGDKKALIEYCTTGGFNIDLNGDGIISKADRSVVPTIKLSGITTCEDYIPCSIIYPCNYNGKELTPQECLSYTCQYLGEKINGTLLEERVKKLFNPGDCYDPSLSYHWYTINFPSGVFCNSENNEG